MRIQIFFLVTSIYLIRTSPQKPQISSRSSRKMSPSHPLKKHRGKLETKFFPLFKFETF